MMSITEEVYNLLIDLPRYNNITAKRELPPNGIYVFYERGEKCSLDGSDTDRIVRIGTHKSEGRFPGRIRQHYGQVNSFRGNKNASIFRKHVGSALIIRNNPSDYRLKDWITQDGATFGEIEEQVSQELRNNFTFVCLGVDTKDERLSLESGLIALLAQFPLGQPSVNWLGKYATRPEIGRSGLWNTQHIGSEPLSMTQLQRLSELIRSQVNG